MTDEAKKLATFSTDLAVEVGICAAVIYDVYFKGQTDCASLIEFCFKMQISDESCNKAINELLDKGYLKVDKNNFLKVVVK